VAWATADDLTLVNQWWAALDNSTNSCKHHCTPSPLPLTQFPESARPKEAATGKPTTWVTALPLLQKAYEQADPRVALPQRAQSTRRGNCVEAASRTGTQQAQAGKQAAGGVAWRAHGSSRRGGGVTCSVPPRPPHGERGDGDTNTHNTE